MHSGGALPHEAAMVSGHSGACPSGPPMVRTGPAQQRMPSPEAGSLRLITGGQQMAPATLMSQNHLAYTGSTPVYLGCLEEVSFFGGLVLVSSEMFMRWFRATWQLPSSLQIRWFMDQGAHEVWLCTESWWVIYNSILALMHCSRSYCQRLPNRILQASTD